LHADPGLHLVVCGAMQKLERQDSPDVHALPSSHGVPFLTGLWEHELLAPQRSVVHGLWSSHWPGTRQRKRALWTVSTFSLAGCGGLLAQAPINVARRRIRNELRTRMLRVSLLFSAW
jgi:hypothetical protein